MPYLMQRLITVAAATGVTPLGAWWRAPDRGLLATPENTYQAALRGRAIGFKGALCLLDNQVDALNRGFTPAAEVAAARQLLATYQAGLAQGRAVLRQEDRILDAGMAAQARHLLALAEACAACDAAKAAATPRYSTP
jgi:citrate lyase subunit beta / citryl-CoA lyase